MPYTFGNKLHSDDRCHVLSTYVHRHTANNRPAWARLKRPDGSEYPAQFADDSDWLAHTEFKVKHNGRLDMRTRFCSSSPTWPENPELR